MVGSISYADHRSNESAIFGDIPPPPPLYLPCSGRVDHWAKVAGFPSLYSQLITAEFTNYLMVRYPNIKIYATEVKYMFILLTSVVRLGSSRVATLDKVRSVTRVKSNYIPVKTTILRQIERCQCYRPDNK